MTMSAFAQGEPLAFEDAQMFPFCIEHNQSAAGLAANTAGSGLTSVATPTIPANQLDVNGDRARLRVTVACAANGNNKRVKISYGATAVLDTTVTDSGSVGIIDLEIQRVGANSQFISGTYIMGTAVKAVTGVSAAGSMAGATVLTIEIAGVSAGDLLLVEYSLWKFPAVR